MSSTEIKTYNTIPEFMTAYQTDAVVQRLVKHAYGDINDADLKAVLNQAVHQEPQDRCVSLNASIKEPMTVADYPIAGRGLECMLVAVFCRGDELIARYSINGHPMLDLVRTPKSVSCYELPLLL